MKDLQKIEFTKGLDTDTDPLRLQPGQYDSALNVRHLTDASQSTQSIVPIKGNKFADLITATVVQSKIYAVAINSVNTTVGNNLQFSDVNGIIATTGNFTITAGSLATTFNTAVTGMKAVIQTALTSAGITSTVTLTTTDDVFGYVIITLTNRIGLDYILKSIGASGLSVFIEQDAIDSSLVGSANVIGSYDLLGDLFIWSTSNINLPTVITPIITTITGSGSSATVVTNSTDGLSLYQKIRITGTSNVSYNSVFIIIQIISPSSFVIANNFGNSTGGNITIYPTGVGEIGVVRYDPNTDVYSYIRLIKSIQLNFTTKKQIDSYIEQNNIQKSLYWTDDYNAPRVMYYKGDYIQDGFLSFYNSVAQYELDTINQETTLILSNTDFDFSFAGQSQVGGEVKSGNWRYAFRFLTSSFTPTQWSELSNPVPVFKSDTGGTPSLMSGDEANTTTPKINNFSITGIIPNLFQYIEMAAINYVGDAIVGYIISRTLLNSNSSINLSHTGLETGVTNLDLGTLNQIEANYKTAKNISAVDNRLILSNLTTAQRIDFGNWTKSWTHSTAKLPINAVRLSENNLRVGEYNDPNNVYNFVGYMDNEVYRFGARFKLIDGTITDTFWIDDIIFDTSSTNVTTPNRRIGHFATYDLTNNSANIDTAYVTYVQFSGINTDTIIGNNKAKDLISEILFERAECLPEILATGLAVLSVTDVIITPTNVRFPVNILNPSGGSFSLTYSDVPVTLPITTQKYGEFGFTESDTDGLQITYPKAGRSGALATPLTHIFSFYSPDILYNKISLGFVNGDVIFNYGNPIARNVAFSSITGHFNSTYKEYDGFTNRSSPQSSVTVIDLENCNTASDISIGGIIYNKQLKRWSGGLLVDSWANISTPIINSSTGLTNVSGNDDYGTYYIQYKRPLIPYNANNPDVSKYGDRILTKYIPTGAKLSDLTGTLSVNVFGGDVFTQKSYVKNRFPYTSSTFSGADVLGWGGGFSFYSQNRVNSQLNVKYNSPSGEWLYPNKNYIEWLEDITMAGPNYNSGYNIKNGINSYNAFDPSLPDQSDLPTRTAYSNLKPQDSLVDNYRQFLPLNFLDLDAGFGEIVHMANGNGELITWQPRKFQRQFFNTRGTLQTNPNLSVLIGDGSVLSRPGQTLTVFGTQHKWSVIKGKSAQGNDTFYWINAEMKKAIRFGYDGTISIADIHGMTSFLANNLTWILNKDNPADGQGICGVWNSRYAETIWSIRGIRNITTWNQGHRYSIGNHVSYIPSVFSTFNKTGEIYVSLTNSNTNNNPQSSTSNWALVTHTDNNYYNEYSLVFNEFKNSFTAFYSPLPKIFMSWTDSYFSPRPVSDQGRMYIHDQGDYCKWYDGDLAIDGYIEGIVNALPDSVKYMAAMRVNSDIIPQRIDFTTFTQISFLTSGEFTSREGNHDAPIKRDSTGTGINDNDTSSLFGKYLKVKMTFSNGIYQKLYAMIVKFRIAVRRVNE